MPFQFGCVMKLIFVEIKIQPLRKNLSGHQTPVTMKGTVLPLWPVTCNLKKPSVIASICIKLF